MKIVTALLLSLSLSLGAATFNVRQMGAVGDGHTDDTAALQQALDAGGPAGGTVDFPAGIYLSRPLTIHDRTTIQIESGAVLQASPRQADFMKTPGDWLKARSSDFVPFIYGKDLTGVTFTGGGVIDGNGAGWWPEAEKARRAKSGYTLPRPNLIVLERCRNVRVEDLTLRNSPKFHLVPSDCEDVVISNVTIVAPSGAANTDAIDPSGRRMLITHCRFDTGDDDIAIKAGKKIPGHDFESEDITVTDCEFLHGHGMSIGSETTGGVRHVVVRHCTFAATENGLRIKSDVRRGGLVEDIDYSDIIMSNVVPAITFTCYYMNDSGVVGAKSGIAGMTGDSPPVYRDIHVRNLTATSQKSAGLILGLPDNCISNVVFENVHISAPRGMTIRNARGIQFINSTIEAAAGAPVTLQNAQVTGLETADQSADQK